MELIPQNIKVALLAGGTSGEREISLQSGKGAGEALRAAGFSVTEFDPANSEDLVELIRGSFDVAFLCLHGKHGEDGTMQGFLETINLPYTGPGVWSSATAIDKAKAKVHYIEDGITTPQSVTLRSANEMSAEEIIQKLGNHVVVKPATEGSALGVSIVEGAEELQKAIDADFEMDKKVVVETYVSGTELTVAVLGNANPKALPVIEIVPQLGEFYDFESKYAAGGSDHICPARLSEELTQKVQQTALAAHKALNCRGVSRTDIILGEDGTCWVLETNTIPGMTATSLLPDAARVAGMDFPQLCTKLIELALE
ncbi:D-alanine--D-alanine ligase [Denitrobacterium detoxificans]|jgi:D-alanine-D-alanine ligase|uniref:D-alanine--D-alanine ligase family protein n=1 Tax=Denitrobacterium detoxificans TaxID=79604 RepID=UPI0026F29923|nr:D-alanine--D-alanine ligase [Denitrobacterium detoxificans]MBE6466410.1 D-alanine--D-alanine ligase [Denitrobacterium detoxificans]